MEQLSRNLELSFCLLLFVANTYSLVHQFTARQVRLSPEDSIAKKDRIDSMLKQHNPDAFANKQRMELNHELRKQSFGATDLKMFEFAMIGNITVGTPRSDIVNINGLSTNMTFGILSTVEYWLFGIQLSVPQNKITIAAEQIVRKLDKPVITVFMNGTQFGNGTAKLTFGSEKSIYCEDNSGYVPLLNTDDPYSYCFEFYASTAAITVENVKVSVEINSSVHLNPHTEYVYCDPAFQNILINATKAVYNSTTYNYQVDCAAMKDYQVILNIGKRGDTTSETTKQLVLTGADYIKYDQSYNTCYLATDVSPYPTDVLILGTNFFNNHCFTYNVNEKTIAFSKAKQADS
uniref:Peptidase A1 domain-containing protein n=1 Tax=Ditylenchus dipsaci TaxID=166011 RepID=A0A915CN39_9BILA